MNSCFVVFEPQGVMSWCCAFILIFPCNVMLLGCDLRGHCPCFHHQPRHLQHIQQEFHVIVWCLWDIEGALKDVTDSLALTPEANGICEGAVHWGFKLGLWGTITTFSEKGCFHGMFNTALPVIPFSVIVTFWPLDIACLSWLSMLSLGSVILLWWIDFSSWSALNVYFLWPWFLSVLVLWSTVWEHCWLQVSHSFWLFRLLDVALEWI